LVSDQWHNVKLFFCLTPVRSPSGNDITPPVNLWAATSRVALFPFSGGVSEFRPLGPASISRLMAQISNRSIRSSQDFFKPLIPAKPLRTVACAAAFFGTQPRRFRHQRYPETKQLFSRLLHRDVVPLPAQRSGDLPLRDTSSFFPVDGESPVIRKKKEVCHFFTSRGVAAKTCRTLSRDFPAVFSPLWPQCRVSGKGLFHHMIREPTRKSQAPARAPAPSAVVGQASPA
jgi:hypothetical protein